MRRNFMLYCSEIRMSSFAAAGDYSYSGNFSVSARTRFSYSYSYRASCAVYTPL